MKNLILTAVFLCFLNSCTKDSATSTPVDTLPPITTIGANTAGCLINGKVLIPKNGSQAIGGSPLYLGMGDYTIGQSNGEKFILASNNPQIILETHYNVVPSKKYISNVNSGTIKVTRFDYPNGIYSGIFNCTLYNVNIPSEKIQITDGRFDIKISTLNR